MGHYFSDEVDVESAPRSVPLVVPGFAGQLVTDRGVFSADRVDPGSRLLLVDGPDPVAGDRHVVDVGAGYGPIACTLAARNPGAVVWAVEVNPRARLLCRRNAADHGLHNVRVVAPEEVPSDLVVDRVWSNPPIRIGKDALHELIRFWLARLGPGGSAHLVVQRHLGADSLARWIREQGHRVERRGSRRGYRLLDVWPESPVQC